jgi:hypothetical protein
MFVEQQMQLIESVTRNLPMMLLVQIPKRHRIGENLVQMLDACLAYFLTQRVWQFHDRSERLSFRGLLANLWPGPLRIVVKSDS